MRAWLLAFLFIPIAAGQTLILEDSSGDTVTSSGQATPQDAGHVDLKALYLDEAPESFTFLLEVDDLSDDDNSDQTIIDVDFSHADKNYRIQFASQSFGPGERNHFGRLMEFDPGRGQYVTVENVRIDVDAGANTLSVTIPREQLLDGNGTAPSVGRSFDKFRAAGTMDTIFFGGGSPVSSRDNMPDDGYGPLDYEIQQGLRQSGDARLHSDNPVRASNGEKAIFVYYVQASNLGPEDQRFDLEATSVPQGWDITLPAATIRIEANSTRTFPVLVSVPFAHQHGAFENFILEMTGRTDSNDVGRVQLGIRYLAIPQPAGHHDRVFIHTRTEFSSFDGQGVFADFNVGYMNTLEDDEKDENVRAQATNVGTFGFQNEYRWEVYLEPGLQMGLDFDINRTGSLTAQFSSDLGVQGATLSGALYHYRGEVGRDGELVGAKETLLASLLPSNSKDISGSTAFDVVVQPTKDADLVTYSRHQALMLELRLTTESIPGPGTSQTMPFLTGGEMTLPLNEYRDRIEGVFNQLAGLTFRHDGSAEKSINPGETRIFNLTLSNEGAVDDVFALKVNGTNLDWVRILGDQKIFVPTGSERQVVVAVSPPTDAPQGDIVDLIVSAVSISEPSVQGNIRVVAVVDNTLDHPDESYLIQDVEKQLTSKKKSPGLPIVLVGMALLALARRH